MQVEGDDLLLWITSPALVETNYARVDIHVFTSMIWCVSQYLKAQGEASPVGAVSVITESISSCDICAPEWLCREGTFSCLDPGRGTEIPMKNKWRKESRRKHCLCRDKSAHTSVSLNTHAHKSANILWDLPSQCPLRSCSTLLRFPGSLLNNSFSCHLLTCPFSIVRIGNARVRTLGLFTTYKLLLKNIRVVLFHILNYPYKMRPININ